MYMRLLQSISIPLSIILTIFILFVVTFVNPALADNGPHGGYTPLTDACAGCHRAHTASAANLLIEAAPALCLTCHGSAGTGADTNVVDGLYLERDSISESPAEGATGQGLKGGGFTNALIDTDRLTSTTAVLSPTTSSHLADGSTGTAWGNGPTTTIAYAGPTNFSLSCISCHNPHGEGTYRILRAIPANSGAGSPVTVSDESTKTYTVADIANTYMAENYSTLSSPLAAWCSQCHTRYLAPSGSGHTDSGDHIFAYRHTTTSVACTRCHVAHGTTATMAGYAGLVNWPDDAITPDGNARSSLLRLDNRGVCAYCHLKSDGTLSGGACDACHGAPPDSGAHQKHAGAGAVGYGLTGSFATDTDYMFGCGECHPLDPDLHQNGAVNVVLSPTGAPAGSPKSQNGAAAAFSGGSCGNVYCHSGLQVTSGAVGNPLTDGGSNYILDSHGNLTYDPYTVNRTRVFQTTPAWNGGQITTCDACHEFPLTTSYPSVEAGVGDSHQWIDSWGYGNLHGWNMGWEPLSCRTCHYGEVTAVNTWSRTGDVATYDPVPLASRIKHANGGPDIVFDTVNGFTYNSGWSGPHFYSLVGAAYNPVEKSCTNVGCHKSQNYVQWGSPYRWGNSAECDLCHRYMLPSPPPLVMTASAASMISADDVHSSLNTSKQACVDCHTRPHGGG